MAEHRHKRETNARRFPRTAFVAGPIAGLATLTAVTAGVVTASPQVDLPTGALLATAGTAAPDDRALLVSRSERRTDDLLAVKEASNESRLDRRALRQAERRAARATRRAIAAARKDGTRLWTTAPLNIWSSPDRDARNLGELEEGKKVLVTGRKVGDRVELVLKGESRWVSAGYLGEEKPLGLGAGLSNEPCPDPGVESGLTANAVLVYRSVCHAFPQITSYGGWDGHGEHSSGRALDIMTSDVALGTAIAEFLRSHAAELHLYDVLWRQRIWTPERASEGWRAMSSRGSATANHYDHVHVATY